MTATDTPASNLPESTGFTALVVDDNPVDRHLAGALIEKMEDWKVLYAGNGVEALDLMKENLPSLVLTDMLMPEMGGLELVQSVRTQYPKIPVILMTAHGSEDIAIQALQRGAASYVPKRALAQNLAETVETIVETLTADKSREAIFSCIGEIDTQFVLDNDTALIAPLVSYVEDAISQIKLCEPSGLILLGVALHEAVTNAMFHGNLGLASTMKEEDEKKYYQLAKERRTQEPYKDRRVRVRVKLSANEGSFTVTDDGEGFDPNQLPDPTDPTNLDRIHGRGLLLIQTFMDRVEHNPRGNEITMTKHAS